MSKKKVNKKSVMGKSTISNAHDPLAWLMQESTDGKPIVEDKQKGNKTEIDREVDTNVADKILAVTVEDKIEPGIQGEEAIEKQINTVNADVVMEEISETGSNDKACKVKQEDILIVQEVITEQKKNVGVEMDASEKNGEETLVLEEDISIVRVAQLKDNWLPLIDSRKNVSINAQQVEEIDAAGLQLLFSFVKTVKASGRAVKWVSPSDVLDRAVMETALKDVMGFG